METFIQDIRYGIRMLLKSPGFTAVAVLALALGIGANSAMFSVVNAVLLRPLPYPKPEQLFMVWKVVLAEGGFGTTPAEFLEWRQQNHVFKEMGAFFPRTFNLAGRGEPEQIEGLATTPGFFTTLGIKAIRGRTFLPEEEKSGKTPAVLVSYRLWDRKFQADPNLIGSTLNLNDEPHVVVGIMPQGFEFSRYKADVWVPLTLAKPAAHGVRLRLTVIARLKPGVKPAQAQAEMSVIGARLRTKNGKDEGEEGPALVPLEREVVGNARETLLPMLGAVGLILLIGCATVANLLLARATMRHREMAVRAALGADRSRLIRQMLTESVLLATLGGMLGLVLANWGTSVLIAAAPENVPRLPEIEIDLRVLGFTLLISVLTGILFGLAPALRTSRIDLTESLKEGTKASGTGFGRHLLQNGLVVCEIALALVLLVGAGLLINSFAHLIRVDPGFRPENVLTMQISVPPYSYRGGRQISAFFRQVVERVRALPNVECAAVVPYLPLGRGVIHIAFTLKEGIARAWAEENKDWQVREFYPISPGYFQAMGTPLLSGRDFMDHDNIEGAPPVAIINESFSRKFFPEESPLGKRIRIMLGDTYIGCTIVGVAKDMKRAGLGDSQLWLSKGNMAAIYLPHSLLPEEDYHAPGDIGSSMRLVVRTKSSPLGMAEAIRREIWTIDKNQPVTDISTMEKKVMDSVASRRIGMLQLTVYAAVALLLAVIGIYGVVAYTVAQRTKEVGIRLALGAQRTDVFLLVVRQCLVSTLLGIAIGCAGAHLLTRVIESQLFAITRSDPPTYVGVSILFVAVVVLASYIPARRATKIDPMEALRYE